jgi:hypothetical protein
MKIYRPYISLVMDGITDSKLMAARLIDLNNKRAGQGKDKVKIHVTGFMLGGQESDSEKKIARDFMSVMAETTQGSFRDMSGVI